MTRFGNYLYVGGGFKYAGGILTPALARWDGNNWDSVPGAHFFYYTVVSGMTVYNNELYICGAFDSVGNTPANSLAKWDGTTWSAIGPNFRFDSAGSTINCIQFYHNELYVGGHFYDPSGNFCRFAKWDGTTWQFLCNEMAGGMAGIIDMTVYNDELIVGGMFYQFDGHPGNAIKKWNDTVWTDVGGSVQLVSPNPQVRNLTVHNGKLYCAGTFEMIGGVDAKGLAVWDGTNWCSFGSDFEFTPSQPTGVQFVNFLNDTMIVGGAFRLVDGDSCIRVARWIGGNFVDTCGNTTSIQEQPTSSVVNVFPSPTSSELTFQFPSPNQKSILLHDSFGRLILTEQTSASQHTINVSSFAEGIYFYAIIVDGETASRGKFVVQH